ncbi:PbsX family transcriptional regulator [Duganella sp. FT80W]|uniref:PbsX family transcriptional regulator n=1 Tax=Duganella guangzhouensis TaxID=2666084 RepID=A0A6I2L0E7_9BURK|nr:AbrB/MazE/SpoVT family DNA-binding domain-containing protein [Duganella guangzhouensis]MRW91611.1 PbsX family transcriptional regulator [Duganella guangzhouensis]
MKTLTLKVQQVDAQFIVVIPADIATKLHLSAGQPIKVIIPSTADDIHNAQNDALTLEQKLALYDAEKMGGEVMADIPAGKEVIR